MYICRYIKYFEEVHLRGDKLPDWRPIRFTQLEVAGLPASLLQHLLIVVKERCNDSIEKRTTAVLTSADGVHYYYGASPLITIRIPHALNHPAGSASGSSEAARTFHLTSDNSIGSMHADILIEAYPGPS